MLYLAPQSDSGVRANGTNSAMCRSPAAGKVPQRSSSVSLNRWRCAKSSLENFSASGRPSYGASESSPPTSSTSLRRTSNPSSPSTSSDVSTGKWLTPVTDAATASPGRPSAMARSMQKLPTSWQSPTVLMLVSRLTARVRVVIGLVMLKSQASGQHSSMALPTPTRTGMLRRARLMPPGPTESPTVWVMPCAAGTSRSTAMERKPPVEMHTMTKSAPSSAARRSVVVATVAWAPMASFSLWANACILGSGAGSMSSSTRCIPASAGVPKRSAINSGPHW